MSDASSDNERYVVRASADPVVTDVTPANAGWAWSGLRVQELAPGESLTISLESQEAVVLPLRGGVSITLHHPELGNAEITLAGRASVFAGPTDFAYLPLHSTVTITAPDGTALPDGADLPDGAASVPQSVRIAIATAQATRVLPIRVVPASEARVDLRGAGPASRRVTNYTLGTDVEIDHLLVCEVLTPGGNWSSYPPHKHDVHGENERDLEEIYYFEVADGPTGPGVGYHRTYGTDERPIDVFAEVRTGDVVLVPHGYHGPCMAAPGYDLYYLNVMAGPASDGTWLSTDDPAIGWVRGTWAEQDVDPRLLTATNVNPTSVNATDPTSTPSDKDL